MLFLSKHQLCALFVATALFVPMQTKMATPSQKKVFNRTKGALKEELGAELKSTLDECFNLNARLAQLQIEVTQLQKKILAKGEELIDNGPSFKKKEKTQLAGSIKNVETARKQLSSLRKTLSQAPVRTVMEHLNSDECLG